MSRGLQHRLSSKGSAEQAALVQRGLSVIVDQVLADLKVMPPTVYIGDDSVCCLKDCTELLDRFGSQETLRLKSRPSGHLTALPASTLQQLPTPFQGFDQARGSNPCPGREACQWQLVPSCLCVACLSLKRALCLTLITVGGGFSCLVRLLDQERGDLFRSDDLEGARPFVAAVKAISGTARISTENRSVLDAEVPVERLRPVCSTFKGTQALVQSWDPQALLQAFYGSEYRDCWQASSNRSWCCPSTM